MSDLLGDADRRSPKWSQPLAPLPDWMRSVEALLAEQRARASRRRLSPARTSPDQRGPRECAHYQQLDAGWLARWRERHELSEEEAAQRLGYSGAFEIHRLERGRPVKRNPERQMRLALERAPEVVSDRSQWLRSWRLRMGFTTRCATAVLGYGGTYNLYRVEMGPSRPSWEKILIAIAEERLAREPEELSPTAARLPSNPVANSR